MGVTQKPEIFTNMLRRNRSKGRSLALQTLFEIDLTKHHMDDVLGHLMVESDLDENHLKFAREIVFGVLDKQKQIDSLIKAAQNSFVNAEGIITNNISKLSAAEKTKLGKPINLLKNLKIFYKTKKELDRLCSKDQISHQGYVAEIEELKQPILKEFIKNKKENYQELQ